jgi:hypothetical protein
MQCTELETQSSPAQAQGPNQLHSQSVDTALDVHGHLLLQACIRQAHQLLNVAAQFEANTRRRSAGGCHHGAAKRQRFFSQNLSPCPSPWSSSACDYKITVQPFFSAHRFEWSQQSTRYRHSFPSRMQRMHACMHSCMQGQALGVGQGEGALLALLNPEVPVLDLSSNSLIALPLEVLWHGTSLLELDLTSNNLNTLAAGIAECSHLERIVLDNNQLTSLPPVLSQLQCLKVLQVSGNSLDELPAELGMLTALKMLVASRNCLHTIDDAIGGVLLLARPFCGSVVFGTLCGQGTKGPRCGLLERRLHTRNV